MRAEPVARAAAVNGWHRMQVGASDLHNAKFSGAKGNTRAVEKCKNLGWGLRRNFLGL